MEYSHCQTHFAVACMIRGLNPHQSSYLQFRRESDMPFGTFSIISYKAKIDAKLTGGVSIGKVLEIWAATNQHGVGISGTIFFKGDLAPGALGSFKKVTPFDSKFTVYLPETYFEGTYAIVSTEKPVYMVYFSDQTFEQANDGTTVEIKGVRIQTDDEKIGEGIDAS